MPTFSYAQAAKGASETPVPAKPVSTEPEKTETKPEEQTNNVSAEPVTATLETETPQGTEKASTSVDEDAEFTTVTNKHANRSKTVHSRTSSPSVRSTAAHSKDGESSNTPNGTQEASEKQAQSDKAEKAGNDTEEQKEKSGKSEKSEKTEKSDKSEKAEKNTPPKELKAAPLPSVNIWLQRKEAQEAKAKTTPAPTAGKATSGKATEENQQDSAKTNSKKKGTDGPQEGAKGSKKADGAKGRDGALPPVEDASSWPTPEVAIGEDKKKAQEKTDKTEKAEKSPVMRAHGKEKWMPVDYVPTAVFNTPLPSAGRGGRRAARGGRDGGRGGSHATAAGEKAASSQPAPTHGGKQASGERGRNEAGTGRAVSLPAQTRRSTSSDVTNSEGRKAQAERNNRPQRGAEDATASNGKQTNGGDNTARPQRDGKQSNRNGDNRNAKGGNLAADSQAATRANDRRFDSGSKSADVNREAGANGFQDFNRERGDSRAERGGRGANRGRGGAYSGYPGQNGQFGIGNNFASKNFGFNDRQRSQHGVANGSQQNNRMSLRSPSLTGSANPYGVYPFPSDINTMYPYQAVNPGPMSAVPYQQYMEPYSLMNMLSMQLEYYFSVDNMCKDMFLRSQMDSQGFTPLSVIATFKRVKSLTEDFELLRHVSRQLRNVEFQTGEDGVDRLRPRENWSQWVLAGAAPAQPGKNDENTPINNHVDGAPNGSIHSGSHGSQQVLSNGTASHNTRTHLSSNAPEFMPSAQNEVATVGTPQDFSYYPPSCSGPESPSYMATNLDNAFIDECRSALGLDSHKMTPPSSPLGAAAQLAGFDQLPKQRHPTNHLARQTTNPPHMQIRQKRPSSQWKGKSHSKQKYANVNKSLEMLLHDEAGGPEQQVLDNTIISSAGYQYWLDCLMQEFNLQMYNEFRRQALDDLFTRHTDDGFTLLMEFYRFALTNPFPVPNRILWDLVGLCQDEAFKPRDIIFSLIRTVASDQESEKFHNSDLIRKHFNKAFGNQWKWMGRKSFR